jgi:hypothetical protein
MTLANSFPFALFRPRLRWRRVLKVKFLTGLVLAIGTGVVFGQSIGPSALTAEHLERMEDPPMFIWGNGRSEARVSQHGPFTSYQVNVDGNGDNITGDAANEPSISVDPTNHNKMVIGWRQFDSVSSNFRQAGWGFTSNGGVSWTFPGVLQNNVFRSDPVLASNDAGHFFYLSLLETFYDNVTSSGTRSTTRTVQVTDSNTSAGAQLGIITTAGNSAAPRMADSPG